MNKVVATIRNWFQSVARGNGVPSRGAPVCRGQATALMQVLLASERDDDYQTLRVLLQDTKWSVARALSWGEVSSFCGRVASPVVLVDRHFQSSDWRFTLSSLLDTTANCCLILLSDVSDPYLWNEMVQHGGFDVLTRPFEQAEVHRTLAFAQKHFEAGYPPLHSPQENGRAPA